MNESMLCSQIEKYNLRNDKQKRHVLFVVPSKSDEHTVYFLKSYVKQYIDNEEYYCTFLCTRTNYSIEDVVLQGDCIITFRKASANFKTLKEAHNVLKTGDVEKYLDYFSELSFVKTVDEIFILGGSELVFPKKTYSKNEPFKSLENSFHDFIQIGYEIDVKKIYTENPAIHFPISTFMYYYSGIVIALILVAHTKGKLSNTNLFCVDPTVSLRFLRQYGVNITEHYIVEDKRGTRNYEYFNFGNPIFEELSQRAVKNPLGFDEMVDFVFGGRLFAENRKEDFDRFFANLSGVSKKIFTPSTMSLKDKETSSEYENFYPPIPYWDLIDELKNARYTLLIRPWTKNDSVNIRLYEALSLGVLPLIADNYDLESLQIDRELFSKFGLIVSNSKDIKRIINSMSEENRQSIVSLLKKKYLGV